MKLVEKKNKYTVAHSTRPDVTPRTEIKRSSIRPGVTTLCEVLYANREKKIFKFYFFKVV
jgi:hypothetical protein